MKYVVSLAGSLLGLMMVLMVITRSPAWLIFIFIVIAVMVHLQMLIDNSTANGEKK